MTVERERIIALLDIDDTLIFGVPPTIEYNDELIDTLLENNVNDIYLLSSMSLKKQTVEERIVLINYLQKKGLIVHGLICASDLVWNKDYKLLTTFYQAARAINNGDDYFKLFEQERFKSLTHFDDAISGQAFANANACIKFNDNSLCNDDARLYQNTASAIRKYLNSHNTSEHQASVADSEKSYCYQMFVKNKPTWAKAVIFIDDQNRNLNAVNGMHNQLALKFDLLTCLNRDDKGKVKNSKYFYQDKIKPFVDRVLALPNAFYHYQSGRQLTYSNEKNAILKRLELALESCQTTDNISQVKANFNDDYQTLNHHRFSFWSYATTPTRSAMVFNHMIELCEKQLKLA